jgi:hypothetical protein
MTAQDRPTCSDLFPAAGTGQAAGFDLFRPPVPDLFQTCSHAAEQVGTGQRFALYFRHLFRRFPHLWCGTGTGRIGRSQEQPRPPLVGVPTSPAAEGEADG